MNPRTIARAHSLGRVALGAGLAVAPGLVAGTWVGAAGDQPGGRVIAAAMGARDVGLGLGMLSAVARGRGARPWLRAAMLADAVDVVATLRAREELPPFSVPLVGGMAGGSVVLGAWLHTVLE